MRARSATIAISGALLILAGCSSTDSSQPTSTAPATSTATTAAPSPQSAEAAPASRATTTPAVMPNVVCMNLQDAQNKIQDAGVFFSRSEDATGAGRRQVVDRNWVVVSQTPDAGSPVGEGEAVLSAVKIGESGAC